MIIHIDGDTGTDADAPTGTTALESRGEVEVRIGEDAGRAPFNEMIAEVRIDAQGSAAAAEQQTQGRTDRHFRIETVTDFRGYAKNGAAVAGSRKLDTTTHIQLCFCRKSHQHQRDN